MTTNHTELCARLRTENSCDEGFYEHCTEAADLIESQAARIAELQRELETARQERNAAGVKARRELMPAYEARIAELEKERDPSREGDEIVSEWEPIETAPKDGSEVLLYLGAPWSKIEKARWYAPWSNWQCGVIPNDPAREEYYGIGSSVPTHWMPLPEGPR